MARTLKVEPSANLSALKRINADIDAAEADKDSTVGTLRAEWKRAKDEAHANLEALRFVRRLRKMDAHHREAFIRDANTYLDLFKVPRQADLFDKPAPVPTKEEEEARLEQEGRDAFHAGKAETDNPYPAIDWQGACWLSGFAAEKNKPAALRLARLAALRGDGKAGKRGKRNGQKALPSPTHEGGGRA